MSKLKIHERHLIAVEEKARLLGLEVKRLEEQNENLSNRNLKGDEDLEEVRLRCDRQEEEIESLKTDRATFLAEAVKNGVERDRAYTLLTLCERYVPPGLEARIREALGTEQETADKRWKAMGEEMQRDEEHPELIGLPKPIYSNEEPGPCEVCINKPECTCVSEESNRVAP